MTNKIEVTDHTEDQLITTMDIPNLNVIDQNGNEIKGRGANVSGMDNDIFEITILGIPYPFYEGEFPQRLKVYNERFSDK